VSNYRVNLDIFAGPLDLLLYLVRKDEVDIYDIPLARVTEQYLDYIEMLKSLDIDIAGDFMVMAATLMEIKSAMLLPRAETEDAEDVDALDPRQELIRQLLEYKKFKDASNLLGLSAREQSLKFPRPDNILKHIRPQAEPEVDIERINAWDLLEAFDSLMKATGKNMDFGHIKDDTPIDLYQIEILDRLQTEGKMTFERVFEGRKNKLVMVGLFLAILELIRNKLMWAEQAESLGAIYLKPLTEEPAQQAVQNAIFASEQAWEDDKTKQDSAAAKPPIAIVEIKPKPELPDEAEAEGAGIIESDKEDVIFE